MNEFLLRAAIVAVVVVGTLHAFAAWKNREAKKLVKQLTDRLADRLGRFNELKMPCAARRRLGPAGGGHAYSCFATAPDVDTQAVYSILHSRLHQLELTIEGLTSHQSGHFTFRAVRKNRPGTFYFRLGGWKDGRRGHTSVFTLSVGYRRR